MKRFCLPFLSKRWANSQCRHICLMYIKCTHDRFRHCRQNDTQYFSFAQTLICFAWICVHVQCAGSIRRTRLFNDHKIMENIQRQPHHRLQHAKSAEQIKNGFGCMRLVDLFSLNVLRQARWHRQQTTFNLPEKCIQSVLFYFALPVIELHVRANGNVHMHCEDWGTEQNRIQRTCATQK